MEIIDWGLIEYDEALKKQEELVQKVFQEKSPGLVILCTHPAVVTLGRKTQSGDVFDWNGKLIEVSRGGRATYHGPSQEVIYPIYNLDFPRPGKPLRDVGWFLRTLEKVIIHTLSEYDISSHGKVTELQKKSNEQTPTDSKLSLEDTGVWITGFKNQNEKKIASLGIAVRNWVTFHGAAINVDHDPKAFWGMNPCGYSNQVMTDLETILQKKIDRDELKSKLVKNLNLFF